MAQFGKHLFGSSFFGKSATFEGSYESEVVDAGEPFDGTVALNVTADLPSVAYAANSGYLAYTNKATEWSFNTTNATTWHPGAIVQFQATGRRFVLNAQQGAGRATATVVLKKLSDNTTQNYTLNSATTSTLTIQADYADYLLTITVAAGPTTPFTLQQISVGVTAFAAEIRTGATADFATDGSDYIPLTVTGSEPNFTATSSAVTAKQYVQVRLRLATSDSDASPRIDRLELSSGDIHKYAANGYWYAAINLKNAATAAGVTFARAKRIEWSEDEKTNSRFLLRSTSLSGNTQTTLPTETDIRNDAYWKPETAPYRVFRNGTTYGLPYPRISLKEAGNGSETSPTLSTLTIPVSVKTAGFPNTKALAWRSWKDLSGLPTNAAGVGIRYAFYRQADDAENGLAPLFVVEGPEKPGSKAITFNETSPQEEFWLRITLERPAGAQSAVVDYLDILADLRYQSANGAAQYRDTLCGLDNRTSVVSGSDLLHEQLGFRSLRTLSSSLFNWPRLTDTLPENTAYLQLSNREIKILYRPVYPDQVHLGLDRTNLSERVVFPATNVIELELCSLVKPEVPHASTQSAPADRLLFHYSTDGGTVRFPLTVERELSSHFTPSLLTEKQYRYFLENGWPDESFVLPQALSWNEAAEMLDIPEADLQAANAGLETYQGKLALGVTLRLPNTSKNTAIQLKFSSTNSNLTEKSYQNGPANDAVVANIPNGGSYQAFEWVSDEVIYTGILNANNQSASYVRTQLAGYRSPSETTHFVSEESQSASELATLYGVPEKNIVLANQKSLFLKGENVLIPAGLQLPVVEPEILYEGAHPYLVEIIPGSVKRTADNTTLPESILQSGSDDEAGLQFSLTPSGDKKTILTRSSLTNGKESLPYSNILSVSKVVNLTDGTVYTPYNKVGESEMGDYILKDNAIDWSPSYTGSKEPAGGQTYEVTFRHGIVDQIKVVYSSAYSEKAARDRLWRSPETKRLSGTVRPGQDTWIELPSKTDFAGYSANLERVRYVVEDNDLWVQTAIREQEGTEKLFASLNGDDPKHNWYPTIQTGFYYLNDQEYYLYSEPVSTVYAGETVPVLEGVTYSENGLSLI